MLGLRRRAVMSYNTSLDRNSKGKYLVKSAIEKVLAEQSRFDNSFD